MPSSSCLPMHVIRDASPGRMSDGDGRRNSGLLDTAVAGAVAVAKAVKLLHASILCMSCGDLLFYDQQYITLMAHFFIVFFFFCFIITLLCLQLRQCNL